MFSNAYFPALTGYYRFMYFYLEPISLLGPLITMWLTPSLGAAWFHHELVPLGDAITPVDHRTTMGLWQLANSYLLLAAIMFSGYRFIRENTKHDLVTQERQVGHFLFILALGDVTHLAATIIALPEHLRFTPTSWNTMLNGNIHFVIVLLVGRITWFFGLGRTARYYGVSANEKKA